MIGRQDSAPFGADHREEIRWVGKPWRRVTLLRNRHFYRGEEVEVTRDLSAHLGLRRLGLGFTFSIVKAPCLDYGEERA